MRTHSRQQTVVRREATTWPKVLACEVAREKVLVLGRRCLAGRPIVRAAPRETAQGEGRIRDRIATGPLRHELIGSSTNHGATAKNVWLSEDQRLIGSTASMPSSGASASSCHAS